MSMNNSEALYWSGIPATNTLKLGGRTRLLIPVAPRQRTPVSST